MEDSSGPVLECSGLRKTYGDLVAVDGVGFTIDPGETYGLLGPNGAGKTTTISMVAGLLDRDAGSVTVGDKLITTTSTAEKAEIGLVPQDLAIYPDLTGRENLRFFGKLYGLKAELKERVDRVLKIIELEERADDLTKEYSGGMKRRLNIGVGLLHQPKLLILDEPTVGVDPQSRNAILSGVERLGEEGMAVLYTTHYMEEAERLCDRVGIIDEGQIIAEGTRRELVDRIGQKDRVHLTVSGDTGSAIDAMRGLPGVDTCTADGDTVEVLAGNGAALLPSLLRILDERGVSVTSAEVTEPDLEAVFLQMTGKALRE
jgi:ABC-2 type transport system ATP-binding protein